MCGVQNTSRVKVGSPYASTGRVEVGSVARGLVLNLCVSSIAVRTIPIHAETYHRAARRGRAVSASRLSGLARVRGSSAPREGVQRHLVVCHLVHTLHNVDFALVRPLLPGGPDTGPYLRQL